MSRIQRLGIGNGGVDCQISYMQGKKYPNAGDIVKTVPGISNRTLLKNPYNTINEPIAHPGQRPLMITTDNRGNVFARSETNLIAGITNDTLLKNPNNIKSVAVGEKRTLSLQRIKDINNKMLPSYITENKGINEVMLQIVTMIENKQVKLITIQLLKILVTKQVPERTAHTEQKVLQALNYLDIVLTEGRRIFKENTLSPTNIPTALRSAVMVYVDNIIKLYNINIRVDPPNIDREIQTGLAELGLLSNALTRMFEYANSIDPSNTLSREQINSAAFAAPQQAGLAAAAPQQAGPAAAAPQQAGPAVGAAGQQNVPDGGPTTPRQGDPTTSQQAGPAAGAPQQAGPAGQIPDLFSKTTIDKYRANIRVLLKDKAKIPFIKQIFGEIMGIYNIDDISTKTTLISELKDTMDQYKARIDKEYLDFATILPQYKNLFDYLISIRNFFFPVLQGPQGGKGLPRQRRAVKYPKY